MSAHASLSPSAAEAWMYCHGYPNAVAGLPDSSSEAAAEGTMAHSISEMCLDMGFEPHDFVGAHMKVEDWTFGWNDDDADLLAPGIDNIREMVAAGGKFYGEHRVNLSNWLGDNQFGTLDRGIVMTEAATTNWCKASAYARTLFPEGAPAGGLIVIDDLKWGRGIPVSPVENKQLRIYALGFWWNIARHITDATEFLIRIDQPRCGGGGGEWRCTLDELLAFGEQAKAAALATQDPDAPRRASAKGCMWCRRREAPGGCREYDRFNLELISMKFDEDDGDLAPVGVHAAVGLEPPLPRAITAELRSYLLDHRKMVEDWFDGLHAECMQDALAGRPTPGKKAVEGRRPPRKWRDAEVADDVLGDLLGEGRFARKLKSPTQVEKEIGPVRYAGIAKHVDKGVPKPVLVPEADARPALIPVTQKFDEEE